MPFAGAKAFPSRYGDAERPTTRLDTMPHITDEEREIIRTHFPTMDRRQLQALLPKRSWNGIRSVARRMKLRRKTKPDLKWKPDEVRVLQEMDPASACSMEIAAVLPGPNRTSITDHSQELGLAAAEAGEPDIRITSRSPPTGWSIGEFLVLLESYPSPNLMMEDIARHLPGKSLSQIRRAAHGANCQTTSGRGPLATRGMGPRLSPAPQPLAIDGKQRLPRGGFGQARSRRRRRPVGPGLREPAPREIIQPGCRRRWSTGHRTVPRHGHAEFCASVANGVGLIRPERRFSRSR